MHKSQVLNIHSHQNPIFYTQISKQSQAKDIVYGYCAICSEKNCIFKKYMNCQHYFICVNCAEQDLNYRLKSKTQPKCLIPACKAIIDTSKNSAYQMFKQQIKSKWMGRNKYTGISLARNCQIPNCQGYLEPQIFICNECLHKHCDKCFRLQHKQTQCIANSYKIPIDMKIKKCKQCQSAIYKEGGCNKVLCSYCKIDICYQCGDRWNIKHHLCSGSITFLPFHYLFDRCCMDDSNIQGQSKTELVLDHN